MKILKVYVYTFCLILFFSCKKGINDPIEHFSDKPTELKRPTRIIEMETFNILKPIDAVLMNNTYFIRDNKNKNIFTALNYAADKKLATVINKGEGPQEVISPSSFLKKNGEVLIYDIARKNVSTIDFLSDTLLGLKEIQKIKFDKRLFIIHPIESNFIASGIFEEYWLVNINKNGEILTKIDFPVLDEMKDIPKMQKSILYISTLISSAPNNRKVVAATQNSGQISFFDYIDNQTLSQYKQRIYYAPEFETTERGGVAYSRQNKVGFCAVDCDDTFVYALYSGKTFERDGLLNHHCENILIYDWMGNPVKRYQLELSLFSMRIDRDKKLIYGIAYNPEGVLVEYEL